ncbi:homoserine O-acetyltransferase MetX [Gulosibacter bifidus]|uniref:Homoserine O-acetyltransferase n=1 Tax=Gulosibacter bifidus TaxID=272239 RepID=A0ABW5RHH0_9MICO|nr:homoserine O-acetyltransferase [Gulosibacter bifidus]
MHWSDDDFRVNARVPQAGAAHPLRETLSPPASGAWREGDPVANRQFVDLGIFEFEHGGQVPLRMAYEHWGTLNDDASNAILVFHALTGDAHVIGSTGPGQATAGWWQGMIGPGKPLDTDKYYVICANTLGSCQGTTGPSSIGPDGSEWGAGFPKTTIRDQARATSILATALGIDRFAAVIGGSLGGMQALEFACMFPEQLQRLMILAAPPAIDAANIAINTLQADAIRLDPAWRAGNYYDAGAGGGPSRGLALARRMAMLTYRGSAELDDRFGRSWQSAMSPTRDGGRYSVQSYLDFHGNRFTRRFDANSYITLVGAMNSHDVGRNRGGVEAALATMTVPTLVLGVTTDSYFTIATQHRIAAALPNSLTGSRSFELDSPFGHDGFLIELPRVGEQIQRLLNTAV